MTTKSFIDGQRQWRAGRNSLVLILLVLFSVAACDRQTSANGTVTTPPVTTPSEVVNATVAAQNSYADAVSRVTPAVVTINSTGRARAPQQHHFFDDPRFREFFGDRLPRDQQEPQQRTRGVGSGVIVSADGTILTNHHVVDGAEEIRVELNDRRTFDAKVIGSDPPSDLAVLKINANNLPMLSLGDSDRVRVGDVVLAIGNPLGLDQTVTAGIISAKGRATRGGGLGDGSFEDFLQTDAPINQGNSGGALINTSGELIGINSQILSPSGGNIGIGFAIPSNMARSVMDQLIKTGKVRRGQLGVQIQPVTSDIAASLDLKEVRGAIVNVVSPGSAAERAGIRQGDVITAVNNAPVTDTNSLRNRVAGTQPGSEVTVTVLRDGREQQLRATLGEFSVDAGRTGEREGSGNGGGAAAGGGKLGVRIEPLTPELTTRLSLRGGTQGVVVTSVDPAGPAADAGIREGDVIEQVNRQSVRSVADLSAALDRTSSRPALLLVNRRGTISFLTVRLRQ